MVMQSDAKARYKLSEEDMHKFLTFILGEKIFAVSIMKVKEIIEYGKVLTLPMMPDFICGAINLRGKVVPIIDLSSRLGGAASEVSRRTCIIVVEMKVEEKSMTVGVMVDSVSKVLDFQKSEIDEAPSFGGHIQTDFIQGMGKTADGFIIILNLDKVLGMDDLQSMAEMALHEDHLPDSEMETTGLLDTDFAENASNDESPELEA